MQHFSRCFSGLLSEKVDGDRGLLAKHEAKRSKSRRVVALDVLGLYTDSFLPGVLSQAPSDGGSMDAPAAGVRMMRSQPQPGILPL